MEEFENIFAIIEDDEKFFSHISQKAKNLYEEAKKDLNLTRFNIQEKSLLISSYRMKWVMIYFREKTKLKEFREGRKKLLKQKIDKQTKGDRSGIPRVQIERTIVESDNDLKRLDQAIKESEELVDFLQSLIGVFNDFGFTVKNSLDSIKLSDA
jgi:hypothetical protein